MSIQVIVQDNNLDLALEQLRIKAYYLNTDHWYKKCHDYRDKPPSKKRKLSEMNLLLGHSDILQDDQLAYRLKIHVAEQYHPKNLEAE
ncbi:hypothetical protein [Acinetobacter piscicola]|uniref:hypothetical protein n=1 Tax=Acinetobacter piscicola TaxID=2006115 RepID=UPI00101F99FF|nr:hypothetical protein [Acinetobacter piscicola]RYL26717.1 hypothetical protein EWP19_08960 [Acinetobacter piscicola]